jgi:hypothetical protein
VDNGTAKDTKNAKKGKRGKTWPKAFEIFTAAVNEHITLMNANRSDGL